MATSPSARLAAVRLTRRSRRRANEWSILVVAVTLVLVAGPTLLLARLTFHVWTGVVFTAAVIVHVLVHRRSIAVLPGGWSTRPVSRWVRTGDALREVLAVAVILTSVSLSVGWPGETLHLVAGFLLVSLAIWHALVHRRWIGRVLRRGLATSWRSV
jgi:hypothetical protein